MSLSLKASNESIYIASYYFQGKDQSPYPDLQDLPESGFSGPSRVLAQIHSVENECTGGYSARIESLGETGCFTGARDNSQPHLDSSWEALPGIIPHRLPSSPLSTGHQNLHQRCSWKLLPLPAHLLENGFHMAPTTCEKKSQWGKASDC